MHNRVPGKFRLKDSGFKSTDDVLKASSNDNSFIQSYNDYLDNNDILSFSFVRHPFERYLTNIISGKYVKISFNISYLNDTHFAIPKSFAEWYRPMKIKCLTTIVTEKN